MSIVIRWTALKLGTDSHRDTGKAADLVIYIASGL